MNVAAASSRAAATWKDREPYFHISSPREGWEGACRPHADFVDPRDFPDEWRSMQLTLDVEAKAKERAVLALRDAIAPA